jgi:hypothetical protein
VRDLWRVVFQCAWSLPELLREAPGGQQLTGSRQGHTWLTHRWLTQFVQAWQARWPIAPKTTDPQAAGSAVGSAKRRAHSLVGEGEM